MKKKLLSISIASILATAIGCGGSGGGGGSNNNNDDDTPASQSSTLSGKASKGIIQSGWLRIIFKEEILPSSLLVVQYQ